MRKKSHISLAKHIINISDIQNFARHKKAFYIGSILPDCKPSFLTKRHEITGTIGLVEERIWELTHGYHAMKELSTVYFTRLGEVVHYVADYFTFPHNKEYTGNIKEHCVYEGELKHRLREYIRNFDEQDLDRWKSSVIYRNWKQFRNVSDICTYIREQHRDYIQNIIHTVEEDCKYIVRICSQVVMGILHVCMATMSAAQSIC